MTAPEITDEMLNPGETGSMWNAWPTLPVVKVDIIDPTDGYQVLNVGTMIGRSDKMRQVRERAIPVGIPIYRAYPGGWAGERANTPAMSLANVRFVWSNAKGQEDSYEGRHVLAVLDFPVKWHSDRKRMELVSPAVVVTLGCEHTYETLTKRNCYIRQRCTICGHTYAIDSGD